MRGRGHAANQIPLTGRRDLQAWEYVPLGPFTGKSFLTSVSPWVVPLAALESARVEPQARDTELLPYLCDDGQRWGLDLTLEVRLNGEVVSRPPFASMYWTPPQQLAHLTVNGAAIRTGDLFASGTVSGPDRSLWGSLMELSSNGERPLTLSDGTSRSFLEDGDEVIVCDRPLGRRRPDLRRRGAGSNPCALMTVERRSLLSAASSVTEIPYLEARMRRCRCTATPFGFAGVCLL